MIPAKPFLVLSIALLSHSYMQSQSFLMIKDDKIHQIVHKDSKIEKLAGDFKFTEGPVWTPEQDLLFTDIPANIIYRWSEKNGLSVYMEPSGRANGLMYNPQGKLILCQHDERQLAVDNEDGTYNTITNNFDGKKFNSPNDLAIKNDGAIYFTDPAWGLPKQENDPAKEIPYQGLFMYYNGKTILLDNTLLSPNGLALSPDEKFLYVADYNKQTDGKLWYKYKLGKNNIVKGKKLFADASSSLEKGGPDGMAVDIEGNLYLTGPGGVLIYDSSGTYLGLIRFPELPANCTFGGIEGKSLFVTARTGLYKIDLNIPGSK